MTVSELYPWRRESCSAACHPRYHDLDAHEEAGYQRGLVAHRERVVRTGCLTVDLDAKTVHVEGQEVILAPREWAVLVYLVERIGQWVTSREILIAVWGTEWINPTFLSRRGDRGDIRPCTVTCARLRQRLGVAGRLIVTRTGRSVRRLALEPAP